MLCLLAIGDLHFDKLDKLFGLKGNQYIANSLDLAFQYAWDNGIEHVVQLGDVSEKAIMSYTAHELLFEVLKKWDGKLNIYFILGNHDFRENEIQSLKILQSIEPLFKTIKIIRGRELLTLESIACNFLSYPHTEPQSSKQASLVFGHFEVAGATSDNGRMVKEGHTVKAKHFYVLGHLHTPHDVGDRVHYVGTMYQLSFGEKLPKGYTVLKARYVEDELQVKCERIKIQPLFKLRKLIVETLEDYDRIVYDPHIVYKVFVNNTVNVPKNLNDKFPNIIELKTWETKTDLACLEGSLSIVLGDDAPELDEDAILESCLREQHPSGVDIKKIIAFKHSLAKKHGMSS